VKDAALLKHANYMPTVPILNGNPYAWVNVLGEERLE